MRKPILGGLVALAVLVPASVASATAVTVTDPTAGVTNTFTGSYTYNCPTATNPNQTCQATQTGYVQVNSNGAVACNGNPTTLSGGPVGSGQGYVWVGSGNAPSSSGFILQGNSTIGAGSYGAPADGQPGQPCPQSSPTTGVTP